jgi:N-acetylmuramoyl-L-alanine amidase
MKQNRRKGIHWKGVNAVTTRELFARLIRCEAGGEGEAGMRAVATVVMNRARAPYGEYMRTGQGDPSRILDQACQFACLKTVIGGEEHTQNVWVLTPEEIHLPIAAWGWGGGIHTGTGAQALWFMNPFSPQCPNFFPYNRTGYWFTRIHEHCFFNPTELYAET